MDRRENADKYFSIICETVSKICEENDIEVKKQRRHVKLNGAM